jgi:hypothetical protein
MQNFTEDVVEGRHESRWRSVGVVLLAGACFGAYWGWLGWDQTYQRDPITGVASGPYEQWQVVGCVLSLAFVAVLAGLVGQAAVAMVVMPIAFTIAWSIPAQASDGSGLWLVGAIMILMGMAVGVCVVTLVPAFVRNLLTRDRQSEPRARSLS